MTVLFRDDFAEGLTTDGPGARWTFLPFGPDVGHDFVATPSSCGLHVASSGTNPDTGEPAFRVTVGQQDPSGLPGTLDHVKWLVYTNSTASSGQLGFDVVPGKVLSFETTLAATIHGTKGHPFGDAVTNPDDDPRLGTAGIAMQDPETGIAFEFSITNETIYVYYERLPNNRAQLGNYASFLNTVPVARRKPGDSHRLKISYDPAREQVRWFVDGSLVYCLTGRLGFRLPEYLVAEHGGTEEVVAPRQLACGMGVFNFLDGAAPDVAGSGLVRLSTEQDFYFDPVCGPPTPLVFLDDESLPASRLWGQGVTASVGEFVVSLTEN